MFLLMVQCKYAKIEQTFSNMDKAIEFLNNLKLSNEVIAYDIKRV